MRKRVERICGKRVRIARLFSSLFVSGVLLFQGTGFITNSAMASDPVARNYNVTSLIGTKNLEDSDYNYGLYGPSLSQTVNIYDEVTAVIGRLSEDSTSLNPAKAESMTVNSGAAFRVGLNESGTSTKGNLYVFGPWGSESASTLTATNGSTLNVGPYGSLAVGYAESGNKGLGILNVASGARLENNGASISDFSGVAVFEGSEIHFGNSDNASALKEFYAGSGVLRNFGVVNVYNSAEGSDKFIVSNYVDYDSTYGRGVLNVTGDALLGSSKTNLYGTVRAGGDLDISSADSNATFANVSTISVAGLASIYNDNLTMGSDLQVNSTSATVGGLWVKRLTASDGTATGGILSVGTSSDTNPVSILNVTGLDEKFNIDGTRSETGLYDIMLGRNATNYGTINLDDKEDGSGIIFSGASSAGSGEVAGLTNGAKAKIVADGDLHLYGIDENAAVTGHGPLTIDNDGTITAVGDLDIASASEIELANSGTVTAGSMTVGANLSVTNVAGGAVNADRVTLKGGKISNAGEYTFKELNLQDGSLSGKYTGEVTTVDQQVVQPKVNLTGVVNLDENTELAHETGDDPLEVTISGNGRINGGTHTLTFTDATVRNTGSRSTAALSADAINFNGGSGYSYTGTGTNLLDGDVTFAKDSSLTVDADNPLLLAEGKTLTMGSSGEYAKLILDIDEASNTPLITLAPADGTSATADIHADIQIEDSYKSYTPGTREVTLIKTSNAGSVYDISLSGTDSNNTLFVSRQGRVSDDSTSYLLDITNRGFGDFALTLNQRSTAEYVDKLLANTDAISPALGNFITDVMDLDINTDPGTVRHVLDTVSGANRANALMLAMTDPWQYSFNQLGWQTHRNYTPDCETCGATYRGQMEYYYGGGEHYEDGMVYDGGYAGGSVFGYNTSVPNSIWAAAHTTSFNARNDDNCDKYGITNTGISVGYDAVNMGNGTLGLTFDYSQPFLYSSWDGVSQHVDQSNFNLGLYGRRDYWNGVSLTGYAGFGLQHMKSKRDVRMGEIDESLALIDRYQSGNNGQSFAAALKLARDLPAYGWFIVRPLVQFDTQQVWLEETEETGRAIALNYGKTDWNRTFVRAGFETEKNTQFCRLTSRFLYAHQLGGGTAPSMTASFTGDGTGNEMTIYGVDLGEKYFDAGMGVIGYLDCAYRLSISGNYDFAASEKSAAHTGTVALNYSF